MVVGRVGLGSDYMGLCLFECKFGSGEKGIARGCLWLCVWFGIHSCDQIVEEVATDVLYKEL